MPDESVSQTRARIFLTHALADQAWASWTARILSAAGIDTSSVSAISHAAPIHESVETAIKCSTSLWVVHSTASANSPSVGLETGWAAEAEIPITYVLVDDAAALPVLVGRTQVLDLRTGSTRRLAERVREAVGAAAPRPTLTERGEDFIFESISPGLSSPLRATYPVPHLATDSAIGRPDLLGRLERALSEPHSAIAIVGPPGSGKTHLVAAFVQANTWRYRDVAWLAGADWSHAHHALSLAAAATAEQESTEPDDGTALGAGLLIVIDDADADPLAASALQSLPTGARVVLILRGTDLLEQDVSRRWTRLAVDPTVTLDETVESAVRSWPSLSAEGVGRIYEASGGHVLLASALLRAASLASEDDAIRVSSALATMPASGAGRYFLDTDDPRDIARWERGVESLGGTDGTVEFEDFELGSWRRSWRLRPGATADDNLRNAEAIARLLEASNEIPNLVVVSGSVLLVKVTDAEGPRAVSKTLTAAQLCAFEADERLISSPERALAFLAGLGEEQIPGLEAG